MSPLYLFSHIAAPFIVGLLQIGLAVAIWRKKEGKDASNRLFALVVLSVAGWAIGTTFWHAYFFVGNLRFATTLTYFAAGCIPYFFLLFTLNFPSERLRVSWKDIFLITIPLAIGLSFVLLDSVIRGSQEVVQKDIALIPAKGYLTYSILIVGYFSLAFRTLLKKFRTTKGLLYTQVQHIFLATFLPTCIGVMTNLILPVSLSGQYMWLGPVATLLLFILIVRSMRKQRLFDLKIIQHGNRFLALVPQDEAEKVGFIIGHEPYLVVGSK
ncbi:MAG: hypothetical protein G01um101433_519 [Parcubacteria group bacterium Gr01-1014_33]|nr:MAG: hypothetical protein G01um101433_519 [Parcubacteria group bacterium Gr01-1014_33]